ncbi:MAG: hypothetical protein ACYDB2_12035 [Acidimicrobiales bacterium]
MNNQETASKSSGTVSHKRKIVTMAVAASMVAVVIISGTLVNEKSHSSNRFAVTGGSPYPLSELLAYTTSTGKRPLPSFSAKLTAEIAAIPSASAIKKALDSSGVAVGYDGVTFSNTDIASGEATCLQTSIDLATTNAEVQGLDPSAAVSELEASSYCLDQAIALEVFKQAAVHAAISSGNGATLAQAQAFAQQQLITTEQIQAGPNPMPLQPGQTAQSITMCSACILAYQKYLDLQYETSVIGGSTSSPARSLAIVSWFSNVMSNASSLTIANVPSVTASNIASFLTWARQIANAP